MFSDHLVLLGSDLGQIWSNQAKMHQCPAALTAANAYFAKKIQARRNRLRNRGAGYITLQKTFYEARELNLDSAELNEGEGIAGIIHAALRQRKQIEEAEEEKKANWRKELQQPDDRGKRTRSDRAITSVGQKVCFFCGGPATERNPLSRASTVELDSRVRTTVMEVINDFNLLGKLSAGVMVALKSQYHKQCLVSLYARTGQQSVVNQVEESTLQRIAFYEIVCKSEDCKMCTSDCKVLKLSDVKREYLTRLVTRRSTLNAI